MSACTRFPDDGQVLRYVTGDLAEPELSAFEDHLFACDVCLARVERYQAAQAALATRDLPAGPVGVILPLKDTNPRAQPVAWWLGAVAALLVVGVTSALVWRPSPPPAVPQSVAAPDVSGGPEALAGPATGRTTGALDLAVLAMVTPPPYLPVTTRGASEGAFAAAMDAYTRHAWAAASRGLAPIDTPEARFFKGIADLMRGDAPGAARALESVRASGQQPWARESAFYLGKAALLQGDRPAARAQFGLAISGRATTAGEARRMLEALDQPR